MRKTKAMKSNPQQQQLELLIKIAEQLRNVENVLSTREPEKPYFLKFIVFSEEHNKYTTIGAENIHHACNKATKLFKGNFTGVHVMGNNIFHKAYKFVSVAEFNEIVN